LRCPSKIALEMLHVIMPVLSRNNMGGTSMLRGAVLKPWESFHLSAEAAVLLAG